MIVYELRHRDLHFLLLFFWLGVFGWLIGHWWLWLSELSFCLLILLLLEGDILLDYVFQILVDHVLVESIVHLILG